VRKDEKIFCLRCGYRPLKEPITKKIDPFQNWLRRKKDKENKSDL